jgi:adenylate cyclase
MMPNVGAIPHGSGMRAATPQSAFGMTISTRRKLTSIAMASFIFAILAGLVGKFLFDIAKPITDAGGEIYLYNGDGLIALWDWAYAVHGNAYIAEFDIVPSFRVRMHGGGVVASVQGDTKPSIGIYGETINIAAGMEEAAKAHRVACVISVDMARALEFSSGRIFPLGEERVRGVDEPILIAEYRPSVEAAERLAPEPVH